MKNGSRSAGWLVMMKTIQFALNAMNEAHEIVVNLHPGSLEMLYPSMRVNISSTYGNGYTVCDFELDTTNGRVALAQIRKEELWGFDQSGRLDRMGTKEITLPLFSFDPAATTKRKLPLTNQEQFTLGRAVALRIAAAVVNQVPDYKTRFRIALEQVDLHRNGLTGRRTETKAIKSDAPAGLATLRTQEEKKKVAKEVCKP